MNKRYSIFISVIRMATSGHANHRFLAFMCRPMCQPLGKFTWEAAELGARP